jgi:hypothetical protein
MKINRYQFNKKQTLYIIYIIAIMIKLLKLYYLLKHVF